MTRKEARIRLIKKREELMHKYMVEEAKVLTIAIEALKREQPDEWCTDCKEYDTEKKCCPRFNKVIREAMKRIPHDDGTLEVKVEDATKVGRVLISDDKHSGGLYYPDEDEPQGDLISRAEAIEALRYAQHRFTVADEAGGMGSVKWSEDVIYFAAAERVLTELPSADRPRGEWIDEDGTYYANCSECGYQMDTRQERGYFRFCPNCGADMKGDQNETSESD